MTDFAIADISVHLAATKNARLRENTFLLFATLAAFLQDNALTTHPLLGPNQKPDATFKILRSDVTDEGFEFIRAALHKWVKAIMAGKYPPTDATILSDELGKLRASRN